MLPSDEKKLQDKVGNVDTKDPGHSDESMGSDLNNIKDTCEDFFSIEKDNQDEIESQERSENHTNVNNLKIRIKKPAKTLYNSNVALSHPDLSIFKRSMEDERPQSQTPPRKKTAFDYLMEEAERENDRLKKKIYEKNSFSSDSVNARKLKELRRKQRDFNKLDNDINTYANDNNYNVRTSNKRREYKKKKTRKNLIVVDPLSIEGEAIESFADFSDSMFSSVVRNNTRMYVCANPDCDVELPSLSRIKRHYLVHTNLKPFKCLSPKCNKRFSRKDNMLQHFRTHCKNKKSKD